jgi:hypothetical protein
MSVDDRLQPDGSNKLVLEDPRYLAGALVLLFAVAFLSLNSFVSRLQEGYAAWELQAQLNHAFAASVIPELSAIDAKVRQLQLGSNNLQRIISAIPQNAESGPIVEAARQQLGELNSLISSIDNSFRDARQIFERYRADLPKYGAESTQNAHPFSFIARAHAQTKQKKLSPPAPPDPKIVSPFLYSLIFIPLIFVAGGFYMVLSRQPRNIKTFGLDLLKTALGFYTGAAGTFLAMLAK